ncbi:hypothetical protein [Nocardia sp. NPDC059239]|uniref:hypothetical protein n=1 Tax=unclassified Nocardia TaxID=2637762 RepID=UPI0036CDF55A
MSPKSLYIVVEGKRHDKAYYGLIAESSKVLAGNYEVAKIESIYTGGGKDSILQVFESMRVRNHLIQITSTGPKAAVFMLDRDAQNICGGLKRHRHVFYSRAYDVEADILINGDPKSALCITAGITPAESETLSKALGEWHRDVALEWREWIILCLLSHMLGIGSRANYSRSTVSSDDIKHIDSVRNQIHQSSGLDNAEFSKLESDIRSRVYRIYAQGKSHTLLKGKWLPNYLRQRVSTHFNEGDQPDLADFEKRVVGNFMATLDPSRGPWARRYREPWESLIS